MSGRTIVVGDVHGCRAELERLLDRIGPGPGDALWFLGDLMDRGPDSAGVVKLVRALGAGMVCGNHDDKHVRYRRHLARRAADPSYTVPMNPSRRFLEVHETLSDGDLEWIAGLPRVARIAEDWVLVHGGLLPGRGLDDPKLPMKLRALDRETGKIVALSRARASPDSVVHWSERWTGPWNVLYGHAASREVAARTRSWGIDTGVVFGGKLTAAVLESLDRDSKPRVLEEPAERTWWSGWDQAEENE